MSDSIRTLFRGLAFRTVAFGLVAIPSSVTVVGCSSSSTSSPAATASGAVVGEPDTHCVGAVPVVVNMSSCTATGSGGAAGAPDDGGGAPEFGDTLFNASGADDDCKYSVSFTDSPSVKLNQAMTFKIVVKKLADGMPATGGLGARGDGVAIEGFMNDSMSHTLPNTTPAMTASETPAGSGVYSISPVKFDASGRWVVRFHLYEDCTDSLPDSPHGHVAFFVDVP